MDDELRAKSRPHTTRRPTRALFKEYSRGQGEISINDWRKVFVECEDLTEYEPALKLCGSWEEWCRFKKEWPHFLTIVQEWKDEVEIRLRSQAVKRIVKASDTSVDAAKWIAEGKFHKRAGKPSKAEVERQAKIEAGVQDQTRDEIERVLNGDIVQDNRTVN
jgi:hypothetical protein